MSDAIRTRDCVIADLTVECKELRAELAAERAKFAKLQDAVLAVLCDPEGNPCFRGSDGDRAVIAEALDLTTQLAAKESAEQEPVARVNAEGFIVEIGDVALANGTKLYTSSPTTSAAVAAFRRKAAEVCRESSVGYSRTNHDGRSPAGQCKRHGNSFAFWGRLS